MPLLLARIVGYLATLLGSEAVRWTATKAFILMLVLTIFPVMLWNFLHDIMSMALGLISSNSGVNGGTAFVYQATGLMAWFFDRFRIPECIAMYTSAIAFKFALGLIPMVRV